MHAHGLKRKRFGGTGQAADDIARQFAAAIWRHVGKPFGSSFTTSSGNDCVASVPEDVDIEDRKVDQVEALAGGAAWQTIGQNAVGQVKHRHEIIADHVDTCGMQIGQAFLVGFNMMFPIAGLPLDALGH